MSAAEPLLIPRKVWTRTEVDRLSCDGLSLELVSGELIDRRGRKPPHVYWKNVLMDWLAEQFGIEYVRSEDPIDVAPEDNPTSEPEPDLIVTYQSIRVTKGSNPTPEDLRLVVEVADSTYEYDRTVKADLYARAGIREYWLIDVRNVNEPELILHEKPKYGKYRQILSFSNYEQVKVLDGLTICLKNLI